MKLVSRKIASKSSYNEIYQAIKSSTSHFRIKQFSSNSFLLYMTKRWINGKLFWVPVKVSLSESKEHVILNLNVPPYFYFYLGFGISIVGLLLLLLDLMLQRNRWIPSAGMIGIGAFVIVQSFWEATEALNKLTALIKKSEKKTGDGSLS